MSARAPFTTPFAVSGVGAPKFSKTKSPGGQPAEPVVTAASAAGERVVRVDEKS